MTKWDYASLLLLWLMIALHAWEIDNLKNKIDKLEKEMNYATKTYAQ
jgi:hypothetical protein